jgi:hypothetical protein
MKLLRNRLPIAFALALLGATLGAVSVASADTIGGNDGSATGGAIGNTRGDQVPEAPIALLLPAAGGAVVVARSFLAKRRRR